MSIETRLQRLERSVEDASDPTDGLIPVDFGPGMGVILMHPKTVDALVKVYGDKDNGGGNESKVTA